MNEFDDDLKKALSDGSDEAFHYGDEETLMERVAGTFRSRARWLIVITWVMVFIMTVLCVLVAVRFFDDANTVRDHIMLATLFLWCSLSVGLLKMWNYMEMNKNTHTREIKRLELQIARLAEHGGRGPDAA